MSERIDKTIISPYPPDTLDSMWYDGKHLYIFNNGEWNEIGGGVSIVNSVDKLDVNAPAGSMAVVVTEGEDINAEVYLKKKTWEVFSSGGGSGVPIVDSVDKLDTDAPVGSVISVGKEGNLSETSVRNLYQPTADIMDTSTGIITTPELLSSVSGIAVYAPEEIINGEDIGLYLVPRTYSMQNQKVIVVSINCSNGIVVEVGVGIMSPSVQEGYTLITYADGVPTVHQDGIDKINTYLADDSDWCYLGSPTTGFVLTEDDFTLIDRFFRVISGVPSISSLFIKKEEGWKDLAVKEEVDEIKTKFDNSIIKIEELQTWRSSAEISPNTYYKRGASSTDLSVTLLAPSDEGIINEYMLEIACSRDFALTLPESVVWANDLAPEIVSGKTYVISIVNNLAVFAEFTTV